VYCFLVYSFTKFIYVVFYIDEEIGPNGRIKRRRKLSEKAAELQAERGRKVSVKKPGSTSKLGKVEVKGLSPVPTKLFVSNGSGGPSSVTPKLKNREVEDSHGYAEDEVFLKFFLSILDIIGLLGLINKKVLRACYPSFLASHKKWFR